MGNKNENLKKYLKSSANNAKKRSREKMFFKRIPVHVLSELPESIDLDLCLRKIESLIPQFFTKNIDVIYVGQFKDLNDDNFNAVYRDGAIYLTNIQDNNDDIIDDIIHEIAHAVEEIYQEQIYGDKTIEDEFRGKRERLYYILNETMPLGTNFPLEQYLNVEYKKDFDDFLYKEIGYLALSTISTGLFYSPYGITSLREYFANGFEAFFLYKDLKYLKQISSHLFNKLNELINEG